MSQKQLGEFETRRFPWRLSERGQCDNDRLEGGLRALERGGGTMSQKCWGRNLPGPRSNRELWRDYSDVASYEDALFDEIVCWDFAKSARPDFHAKMRSRKCGAVMFNELQLSPVNVMRKTGDINRLQDDCIGVTLYESGGQQFHYEDKEFDVKIGDILIWSGVVPIDVRQTHPTAAISILFPRSMVEKQVAQVEELCGRKIDAGTPQGRILSAHILTLRDTLDEIHDAGRLELMKVTLGLTAACVEPEGLYVGRTSYQKALLCRVEKYIREHMYDEEFSISSVAQKFGFTSRNLSRHFAENNATFNGFVLEERVAQAARALESKAFHSMSLTEVALRFGFYDASHFSRSFKMILGETPLQFRRRC
jgi:AraC-like DNA-binding protein